MIYEVISVSLLESRRHSILLAGRRVIWQKQETGGGRLASHVLSSRFVETTHKKGRNTSTKMGNHESSKSLISRFGKTSRLYTVRLFGVFCLVYCYSVEKCLKFAGTFPWKFKITGRLLIAPMCLKPTDY